MEYYAFWENNKATPIYWDGLLSIESQDSIDGEVGETLVSFCF